MIQSGAKVTLEETDDAVLASIFPDSKPWQRNAMAIWSVIWVLCGLLALLGMLKQMSDDTIPFILGFMAFWLYFLFYAVRSLIWQQTGAEYLRIADGNLDYKRSWYGYGTAKSYDLDTIKQLGVVNYDDKKFAKSYGDAFWTIGGEMIGFEYIGKKVVFGLKLDEKQAKQLVQLISKAQKRNNQARN